MKIITTTIIIMETKEGILTLHEGEVVIIVREAIKVQDEKKKVKIMEGMKVVLVSLAAV